MIRFETEIEASALPPSHHGWMEILISPIKGCSQIRINQLSSIYQGVHITYFNFLYSDHSLKTDLLFPSFEYRDLDPHLYIETARKVLPEGDFLFSYHNYYYRLQSSLFYMEG